MKNTECPKCSSQMEIPDQYLGKSVKCVSCGGQFEATEKVDTPKVVESQIKKETKFCQECGAEISKKAVICPKCGVPTGQKEEKKDNSQGVLVAGFLLCFLSLFLFPPMVGLAAFVCGIIATVRGATLGGIFVMIFSLVCGTIGSIIGAAILTSL